MHDYLFPTEVVRFAFVVGVVVSMYLYERRHLTTGSIVVPGYVALFLVMPSVLGATFVTAILSYLFVNKVLMRWVLLYGRVKIIILAIVSICIQSLMLKASPSGPWLWESNVPYVVGIGYVVPALIAHDMARQGIAKTTKAVMLAAGIVAVPILAALLLQIPAINELDPSRDLARTHLPTAWLPLAVLFSAAAAWAVAANYRLRAGGFVGAALLSAFAVNQWQLAFLVVVALVTHQLVTRVLMTHLILFGRRKFAAMLLTSSAIVWAGIWMGERLIPGAMHGQMGVTSLALTPLFIPGLLANDMERSSISRVAVGVSLSCAFVLSTTWTVQGLVDGAGLQLAPAALSAITITVIFRPQLRSLGQLLVRVGQTRVLAGAAALGHVVGQIRDLLRPSLDAAAPEAARRVPVELTPVSPPRSWAHRMPTSVDPERPGARLAGHHDVRGAVALVPQYAAEPSTGYRPRHLAPADSRRNRPPARRFARRS
ncbi:MAG: poly-gamma-glutamate biosynthesis protein PgsC/CapC [Acidimicrobiales bacterium]